MGIIGLCDGDPVVEYLRSTFGANIVRIPRASLRPPEVLAARRGATKTMGQLGGILVGAPFVLAAGDVHEEPAPPVLAQKTRSVALDLGLDIVGGLLHGFGVPKVGLGGAFAPNSAIAFNFHDVHRVYVEANRLGQLLADRTLDRANPATRLYLEDQNPWRLLLIDSVFTSPGFTVTTSRSGAGSVHIALPTLQQLLSDVSAKVKVSSAAFSEVSFTGDERLAFAFTCLEVRLDPGGRIGQLSGYGQKATIQGLAGSPATAHAPPRLSGVLLSDDPAMLDLDDGTGL
jgi:hypothetical protein